VQKPHLCNKVYDGAPDFQRYTVFRRRYFFGELKIIKIGDNGGSEAILIWSTRLLFLRYFSQQINRYYF
jgi:hypothetical protein